MTGNDIKVLEQYQRKSLQQIQSLPDKNHGSAVLALLGMLPLEKVIHKNMLNLFGRWIVSDGIERDIAERQLALKSVTEHSWFNRIKLLLEIYKLPAASHLMDNVPSKSKWKKMVNKAINLAVETPWREDISSRSSLKYINPESVKVGKAHHVWSSVHNNLHGSRRAQLKSVSSLAHIPYRAIVQSSTSLQLTLPANFVIKVQKPDNISWLNVKLCSKFVRSSLPGSNTL